MDYPVIEPDEKKMDHLVSGIQKKFGLELLGIDVIIENGTGRYGVIDINAFPGIVAAVMLAVASFHRLMQCHSYAALMHCSLSRAFMSRMQCKIVYI